jgi:excisionase family DNA binding protein
MRINGRYIVPRPLTIRQVSRQLGCSRAAVRLLVRAGRFPHAFVDCRRTWRIPAADLGAYIRWQNRLSNAS